MWDKIKSWFKRINCAHHWHIIKETRRKIKNDCGPECGKWPEDKKKYSRGSGWRNDIVMYAYIKECCKCSEKRINSEIISVDDNEFAKYLSYPDIDDEPLEV